MALFLLLFLWQILHYDALHMLKNEFSKISCCPKSEFKNFTFFLKNKILSCLNTLKSISLPLNKQMSGKSETKKGKINM